MWVTEAMGHNAGVRVGPLHLLPTQANPSGGLGAPLPVGVQTTTGMTTKLPYGDDATSWGHLPAAT